jgi:hypothetical protein
MRRMKNLLTLALVAGCSSSPSKPASPPSSTQALMMRNLQLVSDDDGTLPPDGAQVVLLFEPGGVADLYRPVDTDVDAPQGSYTYDGTTLSVQFSTPAFTASGSAAVDFSQPTLTLPFHALSTSAGSSTWQVNNGPIAVNLYMVALAAVVNGAAIDDALDRATTYGQALVPGKADQSNGWPAGFPVVTSVSRYEGVITICYFGSGGYCIDVRPFVDRGEPTGVTPPLVESPIVEQQDWNELALPNGVPSPGDPSSDPTSKNAFIIVPLKSANLVHFRSDPTKNASYQIYTTAWNSDVKEHTQGLIDWPNGFNYDDIEQTITSQGYNVIELADGNASIAQITASLANQSPALVGIDSHGTRRGKILTRDLAPVENDDLASGDTWKRRVDLLAKNMLEPISPDLVAKDSSGNYVMFDSELWFEDANAIQQAPVPKTTSDKFLALYVKPAFWKWLQQKQGTDFSHSLVYIGGCDVDNPPKGTPDGDLLRNNFNARAFMAYATEVNFASTNVFFYIVQHLYRHTHTAEEAYYNVLRVLRSRQWIYPEDRLLDLLGRLPCKPEDPSTDPCVVGNTEGLAINFHGYGPPKDSADAPISYLDGAWLTDVSSSDTDRNPGNIWWLLWKARWFSTGSGAVQSLSDCWTQWWMNKQIGGIGDTCTPEAPGVVPVESELAATAYMLSGNTAPFSTTKPLISRWTWNDGATP